MSLVSVYNEWDPLEEIIVGDALYANIPQKDKGMYSLYEDIAPGAFPKKIIEETEEDIKAFIHELEKLDIIVKRPKPIEFTQEFKTLDWEANHYFCYCPRDILLAIGNSIIETPNVFRSRYFENFSYKEILIEYMDSGAKWFSAPKPRLLDEIYNGENRSKYGLKELEPVFDAANILRVGRDIFYLVSDGGNEMGYKWLQTILGEHYRIHVCSRKLYSSLHLDSTICFLRPGLIMINPERVNINFLPPILKKWDILVAPPMLEVSYSDLTPISSAWLGMNFLMLRPDLAVVDKHQTSLINLLEKNGIEVIPLGLRHGRTLGGGFHCITLDVRRKGTLEDYFT